MSGSQSVGAQYDYDMDKDSSCKSKASPHTTRACISCTIARAAQARSFYSSATALVLTRSLSLSPKTAIALGSALKLDNNTDFKIKANTSGQVCTALSHVVANPSVKVGVSAQFDAKNFSFNADKFGVALSFGQF